MKTKGVVVTLAFLIGGLLVGCSYTEGIPKPLADKITQGGMNTIIIADSGKSAGQSMKDFSAFLHDFSLSARTDAEQQQQLVVGPTKGVPGIANSRVQLMFRFEEKEYGTEISTTGAVWNSGTGERSALGSERRVVSNISKRLLKHYRGWSAMLIRGPQYADN